MEGFFQKEAEEIKTKNNCEVCGLYKKCKSPKMSYTGEGRKGILIVSEAPGKSEDEDWKKLGYKEPTQLIGEAGQLLRDRLKKYDLDLDRDFWKVNSLNCRPPKNRKPTRKELKCCRFKVEETIKETKPKCIWLLGGAAIESFYQGYFTNLSINRWRGLCIPDLGSNAWIFPMYHPSYLLRNQHDENLSSVFERDIKKALLNIQTKKEHPSILNLDKLIAVDKDFDSVCDRLHRIIERKTLIAFDYETSNLKPFGKDQKIWTIGVSESGSSFAFPYQYPHWNTSQTQEIGRLWKRILLDEKIEKVAHNLKFEDIWSRKFFGIDEVKGWKWCTMNGAHIEDNRDKFSGLKFQAYIKYGIYPYDSSVQRYISASTVEGRNSLDQVPLSDLLLYCSKDALLAYKLYEEDQTKLFERKKGLGKAYSFFHKGLLCLSQIQSGGISIDHPYYLAQNKKLGRKLKLLEKELCEGEESEKFKKKTKRDLNIRSDKDLRELLFSVMKMESKKSTGKGMDSVDKEALYGMDIPFVKKLLEMRKIDKIKGTYLAQFLREVIDGKIHPFFDLHTVKTYRSCVAKGTKILVLRDFVKYPEGVPIEKVRKGDHVYCFDDDLNPSIQKVIWAGKTGRREVIRIYFHGKKKKGKYIDVTPEHKIRLVSGEYVEAQYLTGDFRTKKQSKYSPKISVLSGVRQGDSLYFTGHTGKNNSRVMEHHFVYESLMERLSEGEIVHHKDGNHLNHELSNLQKMTAGDHARIHCRLDDQEIRRKNIEAVKKGWREGKYKNLIRRGFDHPRCLKLSKLEILRLLFKSRGKISAGGIGFSTFRTYLQLYNIQVDLIKIRFDSKGKYISKNRFIKLSKLGISKAQRELGHNYYKLEKLYKYFQIPFQRRWANQFGSFKVGNHCISKIEWTNKEVDVYDIEIEKYHNFIANEICVHNSSSRFNFQNIPVRDEQAKKITRRGIIPSSGNRICEVDYSSLEVRIAACYNQDENLIKYVTDPSSDMHRDTAMDIWKLPQKEISKPIRFYAKNNWVFPQFYGDWYKSCAESLWKNCLNLETNSGEKVKDHLKSVGLENYFQFETHCKKAENIFWNIRFKQYQKWKDKINKEYQKKGFIETFLGFRFQGYMSRKDVTNYPIQGTAFHCLLWSLIEIYSLFRRKNWKSKIMGQIHDSIVFDLCPDEEKEILPSVKYIMERKIRKVFDWIIVPLEAEFEVTPINGSWYEKKEIKV